MKNKFIASFKTATNQFQRVALPQLGAGARQSKKRPRWDKSRTTN
jgi:hypothetical protein